MIPILVCYECALVNGLNLTGDSRYEVKSLDWDHLQEVRAQLTKELKKDGHRIAPRGSVTFRSVTRLDA